MGKKKPIAKLKKYARRIGAEVKYVTVCEDEKRVTMQVVIKGEAFPHGIGENREKAKNNAAKSALRCLDEKENRGQVRTSVAKKPAPSAQQKKKAKQIHKEICSVKNPEVPQVPPLPAECVDGAAGGLSEMQISEDDLLLDEPNRVEGASDSSNPPSVEDIEQPIVQPQEMNPGNSPNETVLTPSKILRNKSEFQILQFLGKGGFGHVYKVLHKTVDKCYAIKFIPCREIRKALREAKALSDLDHHNIIRYHSCWMEDSGYKLERTDGSCSTVCSTSSSEAPGPYLCIQMELCDNKTLKDWIDEENVKTSLRGSKRREKSLKIALQIVSGLEHIHFKKLIHRDLKPANIMFGLDGVVKIGDFGLVTLDNDSDDKNLMERTVQKGTPSYMAPEQKTENTYDRKVDIFPLGLIYFELLWKMGTMSERAAIWKNIRGQKLPEDFARIFIEECLIIKLMLNMKPNKRPEATEIKTHLDQVTASLNCRKLERRTSRTF